MQLLNTQHGELATPTFTFRSQVSGRVRMKIDSLYKNESLAAVLETLLNQKKGISQVTASIWTGNLLVVFDENLVSLSQVTKTIHQILDIQPSDEVLVLEWKEVDQVLRAGWVKKTRFVSQYPHLSFAASSFLMTLLI